MVMVKRVGVGGALLVACSLLLLYSSSTVTIVYY
jgi:hypothetical protein